MFCKYVLGSSNEHIEKTGPSYVQYPSNKQHLIQRILVMTELMEKAQEETTWTHRLLDPQMIIQNPN